jgi:hypothetical protein
VPETQSHESTYGDHGQRHRPANGILLLPSEARFARTHAAPSLENPDLAGNPVALAHARATRENHASPAAAGHPIGTALLFLVVLPAILFLVSNPLGWLLLFGLCLGFGYLFGFGGIL